jgi:hypothetical protein
MTRTNAVLPHRVRRAAWGGGAPAGDHHRGARPPDDVLAFLDHHHLNLGGTYGDPNVGDPIQYDELRIEHDQSDVEIVVYNRAVPA